MYKIRALFWQSIYRKMDTLQRFEKITNTLIITSILLTVFCSVAGLRLAWELIEENLR